MRGGGGDSWGAEVFGEGERGVSGAESRRVLAGRTFRRCEAEIGAEEI